jgi:hypothetical protein
VAQDCGQEVTVVTQIKIPSSVETSSVSRVLLLSYAVTNYKGYFYDKGHAEA